MGDKLVTDSSPDDQGGGGISRLPSLCYSKKFEELCGYYMSLGMTYEQYWDGDCCMTKYFRRMDELKRSRNNEESWLLGCYIYDALLSVYPVFNALSKKKEPYPYRSSPFPITEREQIQADLDKKKREMYKSIEEMQEWAAAINKRRKEGKVDGN